MPDQDLNYTRIQRNPVRKFLVIGAVVVFHACLILALGNWFAATPRPQPILVKVTIVPDKPKTPAPPHTSRVTTPIAGPASH